MGRTPWQTRFAEETEIHGIAPLAKSRSTCERTTWVIVVLTAMGFATVGVVQTVREYIEQPVLMEMTYAPIDKFPSFMVCAPYWVNESKAANLGMTLDEIKVLGMLVPYPQDFAWEPSETTNKATIAVASFLRKFGEANIDELLQKVSLDPDYIEMLPNGFLWPDSDKIEVVANVLTMTNGPCVGFKSNVSFPPGIVGAKVEFAIVIRRGSYQMQINALTQPAPILYVGGDALSFYPYNDILIGPGMTTLVQIHATQVELHPRRTGGCSEGATRVDHMSCALEIHHKFCQEYGNGTYYWPGKNQTVNDVFHRPCNWTARDEQDRLFYETLDDCKQPCKDWRFEATTTSLGEKNFETEKVEIAKLRVVHPQQCQHFVEFRAISVDGLFSNLGGQLSLYTGASVITLVHLVIFLVFQRR